VKNIEGKKKRTSLGRRSGQGGEGPEGPYDLKTGKTKKPHMDSKGSSNKRKDAMKISSKLSIW